MKKETREDSFIRQPYYEGGDKAMIDFITKNLHYHPISFQNKIEGNVHIKYEIDIKGNVTDVKIISGLDSYCNEEAIRVIKLLIFVVPKNPRKMRIIFHKKIRIHFSPRQDQPLVTDIQDTQNPIPSSYQNTSGIQYNIVMVTKPKLTKEPSIKPKINYTYTINYR
jgi:TonB family protein